MRNVFALVALHACVGGASAVVTPIGPFSGQLHEPLNFSTTQIVAQLPIFGGAGSLNSVDGVTTSIHLLLGDTFNGDTVTPRTGSYILGFTQGPGVFILPTAVRQFGAYFNNNSGADGAAVSFFGAGNALLGTLAATDPAPGNVWTWNGWESDVGITRITVTGNGTINGFLWFDDLELTLVPDPGAMAVVPALAIVLGRRRREG